MAETKEELEVAIRQVILSNKKSVKKINKALVQTNGSKILPLWMETQFNGPLEGLTADCLQGVKAGLLHINKRLAELLE